MCYGLTGLAVQTEGGSGSDTLLLRVSVQCKRGPKAKSEKKKTKK